MQVVLDQLWAEHGEDPEAWPKEVVASLARRNAELARQVGGQRGVENTQNELAVSRPGGHEGWRAQQLTRQVSEHIKKLCFSAAVPLLPGPAGGALRVLCATRSLLAAGPPRCACAGGGCRGGRLLLILPQGHGEGGGEEQLGGHGR